MPPSTTNIVAKYRYQVQDTTAVQGVQVLRRLMSYGGYGVLRTGTRYKYQVPVQSKCAGRIPDFGRIGTAAQVYGKIGPRPRITARLGSPEYGQIGAPKIDTRII